MALGSEVAAGKKYEDGGGTRTRSVSGLWWLIFLIIPNGFLLRAARS
jgi:hypothetical protein